MPTTSGKRPRPVKITICNWSAERWWYGLLQREPGLFARWAWMTEF